MSQVLYEGHSAPTREDPHADKAEPVMLAGGCRESELTLSRALNITVTTVIAGQVKHIEQP